MMKILKAPFRFIYFVTVTALALIVATIKRIPLEDVFKD